MGLQPLAAGAVVDAARHRRRPSTSSGSVWCPRSSRRGQAEAVGVLGALVVAMVVRMAGATGEKKERAEALLAHQALHDMLTGLPNRAYFYERTERP